MSINLAVCREESIDEYLKRMDKAYNDLSNLHDRLTRFAVSIVACELELGGNCFEEIFNVIRTCEIHRIGEFLTNRFGNSIALGNLAESDVSIDNQMAICDALTLAWNQSPLCER